MAAATAVKPAETQRRTRGHNFYAPQAERKRIPALYATEGTAVADKIVRQHYFTGAWDWYVVEVDPATQRAFGYVSYAGQGEWGYFDLPELEAVRPRGTYTSTGATVGIVGTGTLQWVVERDCWWSPVKASEVDKIAA